MITKQKFNDAGKVVGDATAPVRTVDLSVDLRPSPSSSNGLTRHNAQIRVQDAPSERGTPKSDGADTPAMVAAQRASGVECKGEHLTSSRYPVSCRHATETHNTPTTGPSAHARALAGR